MEIETVCQYKVIKRFSTSKIIGWKDTCDDNFD